MTSGADEIKELLQRDTTGNVIGYYLNERDPPGNVRYLVPLDFDYLHIVCRAGLIPSRLADGFSHQFRDVQPLIQRSKVFAGPPGSETRRLFEQLFGFYWASPDEPEDFLHPAISDWVQARAALKSEMIDVVFFLAPFDTDTMRGIASDHDAVLLGLDDVRDALVSQDGNALVNVQLPANVYSAVPFSVKPDGPNAGPATQRKFQFCPKALGTIAARRLMVCSTAMCEADGFAIAEAVRSALAPDSQQIGEADALPIGAHELPPQYHLMEPHSGALMKRTQTPPPQFWSFKSWSTGLLSALSASLPIVLFLLARLIGAVQITANGREASDMAPGKPLQPTRPLIDLLRTDLDRMLEDLERHAGPLSKAELDGKEQQLLEWRTQVTSCMNESQCGRAHAEILFQAIRNVQAELDLLTPRPMMQAGTGESIGGRKTPTRNA
jgi:hypothetical protein